MNTISLRMNDDETKLLRDYVSVNNLNMSKFIRDLVLDKIEDDLSLDEERILKSSWKSKTWKEIWSYRSLEMLGIWNV